ncbi:hypothetical protein RvY_13179 [Ramazzottius varieornatus]|uniref:Uncharacterized protein n=1 Tax=Ramazzottius varieornatus TaxID=947166 RepID=A0A1D1VM00_RAMVA|nr:hypothetical protein RvY_13179 [Ramazzottius varieornatus]
MPGLTAGLQMGLPLGLPLGLPMGPPLGIPLMGALATTRLTYDEWRTIAGAVTPQQQAVPVHTQQPSPPNAQQADVMETYVNAGRPDVKMGFRSNGPPYKPFDRNRLGDRAPFHYTMPAV